MIEHITRMTQTSEGCGAVGIEADCCLFGTMKGLYMVLHPGQHRKHVMLVSMFSILIQPLQ
jgi:hypothetical protein